MPHLKKFISRALLAGVLIYPRLALGQAAEAGAAASQTLQPVSTPTLSGARNWNVLAFGAVGDGQTLDTQAMDRAIRACSRAGGCVLKIPAGRYVIGTVTVLSHVTLDLEPGAVLEGSLNLNDYGGIAAYGFNRDYPVDSTGEGFRMGMLVARNARDIAIMGEGTIDGRGRQFFNFQKPHMTGGFDARETRQGLAYMNAMRNTPYGPAQPHGGDGRPGTMIVFSHCRNVRVSGVTLRDAPNWTLHFAYCRGARITGVTIRNSLRIPNDDGIDCMHSRGVEIAGCAIRAGDDDVALVASRNVTVHDCNLVSRSAAVRIDAVRQGIFSHLLIRSNRGIGIFHVPGDKTRDLMFSHLIVRTRLTPGDWWGKAEPVFIGVTPGQQGPDPGYIRNLWFDHLQIRAQAGIVIAGAADCPITGIEMRDVRLHMTAPPAAIAAAVGGNLDLRGAVAPYSGRILFRHDIPALYARYVRHLRLENFHVLWSHNMPGYNRAAIECRHFTDLRLAGFRGRQAHRQGRSAVIQLRDGRGVTIRSSTAAPGAAAFVELNDIRGEGLFVENNMRHAAEVFTGSKAEFTMLANRIPPAGTRTAEHRIHEPAKTPALTPAHH